LHSFFNVAPVCAALGILQYRNLL